MYIHGIHPHLPVDFVLEEERVADGVEEHLDGLRYVRLERVVAVHHLLPGRGAPVAFTSCTISKWLRCAVSLNASRSSRCATPADSPDALQSIRAAR